MSLIRNIKNVTFFRGLYVFYKSFLGLRRSQFGFIADDVLLTPPITITNPKNVFLYGDNGLNNAYIMTTNARFIMKPHSGAAEGLKVSTGNHPRIVGRFYRSISEKDKPKGLDKDVIVESDVWLGRNVSLLAGVIIGRGSTVAAGAVVTKSIPPYCVCGGIPAKVIKFYWTIDQILEHEARLYPKDERYSREQLELIFKQYNHCCPEKLS